MDARLSLPLLFIAIFLGCAGAQEPPEDPSGKGAESQPEEESEEEEGPKVERKREDDYPGMW